MLNLIYLNNKYILAISNINIDIARDLKSINIKKYQRRIS